jgi:NADH-quinone oxidoreductase subunit I
MYGKGLIKGLFVTGRAVFRKKVTEKYPDVKPHLSQRWRGGFQLDVSQCIACGLCERSCPNGAIKISTAKDENDKKQLSGYKLNFSYCLLCGLCVEACPKHCLRFTHDFETAAYNKDGIILDLYNNQNLSAPMSTYGLGED